MRTTICATLAMTLLANSTFDQEIKDWRLARESKLKADDGWLTVAGLFWLHEGENTAGSDPSSSIALPRGPAHLGVFEDRGGRVTFHAAPGVDVKAPVVLRADTEDGGPDLIQTGDFTMFVIHRGARDAIRLKDKQSEFRKGFTGLHWYPPKEDYRIAAKWVPHPEPKQMAVPNILGETEQQPSPGYAVFKLHGQEYQLHPVLEDNQLFFIFKDQTSGKGTYPSGRFLYADLAANGQVVLDFNKAYNPPCAFTPYATCPLPPAQNRLTARIEAGELNYGRHSP
ncbi:MAG: DUF1684 domain-containing protein [Acidobacteriota bacterium]|nr:DUF1684 domain-containing protein [Acidobacteriota bacterium]